MCKPYLAFERLYWPNKYYLNILCPPWESVCFEVFPLSDFSCCCHQTLERSNLKKEGSILAHTGGCSPPCGAGMVVGTTWGCGSNWLGLLSPLSSSNRNQACGRKWNKAITLRGIFLTLTLSLTTCWWGPGSLVYRAWNKTWKRADLEPRCVAEYESQCFLKLWFTRLEHWADCVTQNEVCKVLGTPPIPQCEKELMHTCYLHPASHWNAGSCGGLQLSLRSVVGMWIWGPFSWLGCAFVSWRDYLCHMSEGEEFASSRMLLSFFKPWLVLFDFLLSYLIMQSIQEPHFPWRMVLRKYMQVWIPHRWRGMIFWSERVGLSSLWLDWPLEVPGGKRNMGN